MTSHELPVKVAINSWRLVMGRADEIFSPLTEDQLLQEVAPGKNRVIYLLDISLPFTTECLRFWAWDRGCIRTWMRYL